MEPSEHPPEPPEPEASESRPPPKPVRRARRRDGHPGHLGERLRSLRDALRAAREGDLSVRLPADGSEDGIMGEVALAFNALLEQNEAFLHELYRVSRTVVDRGDLSARATLGPVGGSW